MQRKKKFVTTLSFAICTITLIGFLIWNNVYAKAAKSVPVSRQYVAVSGDVFGIRLYSDGILVVGTNYVKTKSGSENPAQEAGLKVGDVIKAINGRRVTSNSDFGAAVNASGGNEIELLVCRNNEDRVVRFFPVLSAEDNKYKAGLWVRDSTAGIGTLTYFDNNSLEFAGLGHGICDVDTGGLMPLLGGDTVYARITGSYKGTKEDTGELCGVFSDEILGPLTENTDFGVFGSVSGDQISGTVMPVAMRDEVRTGRAKIISTVDENGPKEYEVEITRIYRNSDSSKCMAITVTDKKLIEKTGGIIQGMSGSPIIQDGMLVGAVTHVLVHDPLRGYGIFAEKMVLRSKNE